jgi:hypothetical protein
MRHEMINMRYEPTTSTLVLTSKDASIKVRTSFATATRVSTALKPDSSYGATPLNAFRLHPLQILDPSPVLQSSATFLSSKEAHRLAKVKKAWSERGPLSTTLPPFLHALITCTFPR